MPALGRALLALTAAAFLVRAAFVLLEPPTEPVADETVWTTWGAQVLTSAEVAFSPTRFRLVFHPPVYPYFIGAFYGLFGSLTGVKLAQAAVGALLVPVLGRIGAKAFGPPAGIAAAALAAFYPELVWFSAHFWAETLFLVVLWWAFERLLAVEGLSAAAFAGLLWGLAVLTRETVLFFAPVAALWLASRGRRALGAVFLAVVLVTVAPWTYRNWVVYRAFVPVSTAGGLNLFQGNARLSRPEVYEQYWAVRGRIEKYRFARQAGLQAIWDRQPTWLFEKLRDEMPNFWEADSQALVHIKRGAYAEVRPAAATAAAIAVLGPYLAVLALFVAGLAVLPFNRGSLLLLGFLAYYNLLHVVTHGYARYRLPAMPVLFLFAGAGAIALRQGALALRRRTLPAGVALVIAICLIAAARSPLSPPGASLVERDEPGPTPSP